MIATCGFLAGDVVHMFHVVPNVADAADGTPADPGLAALADVPVAVPRNDSAQDAANVRCLALHNITHLPQSLLTRADKWLFLDALHPLGANISHSLIACLRRQATVQCAAKHNKVVHFAEHFTCGKINWD